MSGVKGARVSSLLTPMDTSVFSPHRQKRSVAIPWMNSGDRLAKDQVASIGIHLRHRITSHGFAMNITPEPLKWFDLVMACGLADVCAVSLHDLMTRGATNNGILPNVLPSVPEVAGEMVPLFAKVFGRSLEPLAQREGEIGEMWEIVHRAEEQARKENAEKGGWATEPDLSGR